jgi:hypothetical protein
MQRYAILGYESNQNDLSLNINNEMLQIIPREHNFDFHQTRGGIWQINLRYPTQPGGSSFCRMNNFGIEPCPVCSINNKY